MTDIERILPLWRELEASGAEYVLATIIATEGPSYRKPGALMLLSSDGRRAGTVSGGCLESQVASRAWWLTAQGPTLQKYSTAEEDGDRPYGSGCGGVITLLLERRPTAAPLLAALEQAYQQRKPLVAATIVEGAELGHRRFSGLGEETHPHCDNSLQAFAGEALLNGHSLEKKIAVRGEELSVWADFRPARPALWAYGAGDDAQPLLHLGKELGWYVAIADGRSQLVTRARFPQADELCVLPIGDLPTIQSADRAPALAFARIRSHDAVVVLSHSFDQDVRVMASLLTLKQPPAYLGVLGTQRRTREVLGEAALLLDLDKDPAFSKEAQVERWLERLHAPMGLDLGADSPEAIAFSTIAEIQKTLAKATALPLSELRGSAKEKSRD